MRTFSDIKICVTTVSFSQDDYLRKQLQMIFPLACFNETGQRYSPAELIQNLKGARGVIVGLDKIDDEILAALPELEVVAKYGVGLDNIDQEAAGGRDISVGWSPGVNRRSVAELSLAFLLGMFRNVFTTNQQLKSMIWNKQGGYQLSGKKIGIIGLGNIGMDLARLLQPFNCEILVNDIEDKSSEIQEVGARQLSFQELIETADAISLHVPLTEQTDGLIQESELRAMKSSSYLVNTSRGRVVAQNDLKIALQKGWIAGAALDVFQTEPPGDAEFLALPNLVVTPHIGGNALEAVRAMGMSAIRHLEKHFIEGIRKGS